MCLHVTLPCYTDLQICVTLIWSILSKLFASSARFLRKAQPATSCSVVFNRCNTQCAHCTLKQGSGEGDPDSNSNSGPLGSGCNELKCGAGREPKRLVLAV